MPSSKPDPNLEIQPVFEGNVDAQLDAKRQTKQALLLELIARENGASLEELTSATNWLPHTARAAITGLRKRGHYISCTRINGVSRYAIGSVQ